MVVFTPKIKELLPEANRKQRLRVTDINGRWDIFTALGNKFKALMPDTEVTYQDGDIYLNKSSKNKLKGHKKFTLDELVEATGMSVLTLDDEMLLKNAPSAKRAQLVYVPSLGEVGVYRYNNCVLRTNDGSSHPVDLEKESFVGLKKTLISEIAPDLHKEEQKLVKEVKKAKVSDDIVGSRCQIKAYSALTEEFGESIKDLDGLSLGYVNPRSEIFGAPFFQFASHYCERPATIREYDASTGIIALEFDDTPGVTEHTKLVIEGAKQDSDTPIPFHVDHVSMLEEE
jgi:hypothetical protein